MLIQKYVFLSEMANQNEMLEQFLQLVMNNQNQGELLKELISFITYNSNNSLKKVLIDNHSFMVVETHYIYSISLPALRIKKSNESLAPFEKN